MLGPSRVQTVEFIDKLSQGLERVTSNNCLPLPCVFIISENYQCDLTWISFRAHAHFSLKYTSVICFLVGCKISSGKMPRNTT